MWRREGGYEEEEEDSAFPFLSVSARPENVASFIVVFHPPVGVGRREKEEGEERPVGKNFAVPLTHSFSPFSSLPERLAKSFHRHAKRKLIPQVSISSYQHGSKPCPSPPSLFNPAIIKSPSQAAHKKCFDRRAPSPFLLPPSPTLPGRCRGEGQQKRELARQAKNTFLSSFSYLGGASRGGGGAFKNMVKNAALRFSFPPHGFDRLFSPPPPPSVSFFPAGE